MDAEPSFLHSPHGELSVFLHSPGRVASISKLFTWTAVMQQAEAGMLALDADNNAYLISRFRRGMAGPSRCGTY